MFRKTLSCILSTVIEQFTRILIAGLLPLDIYERLVTPWWSFTKAIVRINDDGQTKIAC